MTGAVSKTRPGEVREMHPDDCNHVSITHRLLDVHRTLRGWNNDERPLQDARGDHGDPDQVEALFAPAVSPEQPGPADRAA